MKKKLGKKAGQRGRGACRWTPWTRWTKWTKWGRLCIPRGFAMSCRAALDVRIMRIMRIMRLCDWCADCNNHPCCKSAPSPTKLRPRKPSGYTVVPPYPSHKSHSSHRSHASATPTQTAHRRCHKTSLAYPNGKFAPSQTTQQYSKPSGYTVAHPLLSDRSDRSDASAAPTQHAYHRCHHVAPTVYFPA